MKKTPQVKTQTAKQQRLAKETQALRMNLLKRKAQAAARQDGLKKESV